MSVLSKITRFIIWTLVAACGLALVGIVALFIAFPHPALYSPFWSNLKSKIDEGQEAVYFKELTDFDWDVVCVLSPYHDERHDLQSIPYDLGRFKNSIPNLDDDGLWAFAFVKDDKVIEIKRRGFGLYLNGEYTNNCMPQEKAKFVKKNQTLA
ncbi:MAG: hypothetical protein LRY57_00850 [Alphaproteobacteria bacterium]|nr:hypothetical protein [Alphaproteobacteria bacterium]